MARVECESERIGASTDVVFGGAADFAGSPAVVSQILRVEMVSDPPHTPARVGTRFRETRRMFGKEATEEMEVVSIAYPSGPGERGEYVLHAASSGYAYVSTIVVEPAGEGSSVIRMVFEAKAESFLAKVMSPLMFMMVGPLKKAIRTDFADIKAYYEGGGGGGGSSA